MPFGFHLAVDTLPSGNRKRWLQVRLGSVQLSPSCPFRLLHTFLSPGPRGITPAFGYGAPHPGARGTSTLPINALLSAHYGTVRLLPGVHARLVAIRLPGPVCLRRHQGGLPVLVHVVSRRAWGLRLRRGRRRLAILAPPAGGAFLQTGQSRHPVLSFSQLNTQAHRCLCLRFACRLATASARLEVKMESLLLSCRALSSPTTCRFIPAHPVPEFPRSANLAHESGDLVPQKWLSTHGLHPP